MKDEKTRFADRIILALMERLTFDAVSDSVRGVDDRFIDQMEQFPFDLDEIDRSENDRKSISESYDLMKQKHGFLASSIESKRRWLMWIIESEKVEDLGW